MNAATASPVRTVFNCSHRSTRARQSGGGALICHCSAAALIGAVPASVATIHSSNAATAAAAAEEGSVDAQGDRCDNRQKQRRHVDGRYENAQRSNQRLAHLDVRLVWQARERTADAVAHDKLFTGEHSGAKDGDKFEQEREVLHADAFSVNPLMEKYHHARELFGRI